MKTKSICNPMFTGSSITIAGTKITLRAFLAIYLGISLLLALLNSLEITLNSTEHVVIHHTKLITLLGAIIGFGAPVAFLYSVNFKLGRCKNGKSGKLVSLFLCTVQIYFV